MSEERTEQPAADPTAADAARAELDARATELRRTGWIEPPDRSLSVVIKDAATDEQRAAHREELRRQYAAAKARAEKVLGRGPQRERIVYKTTVTARPALDIPELSKSGVPMTEVKTTNTEHPLVALAEELAIFAARLERDANLKIKAMRAELELHFQRCIADQQKEISELRGMIKALLACAH